jgi:serine/threonine-protein kinase
VALSDHGDLWAAAAIREGDVIDRKYRVERVLGIGGMGVVVAAQHLKLGRVALKFLLPVALHRPEWVARFAEEARVLSRLRSEHVVTVFDVGELPNGAPYIVMEYLEGADLATRLEQTGPLPVEEAVGAVLQTCVAVAEAHRLGIVHRDLKPGNAFCTRGSDGQPLVKLLDFGISKNTAATASGERMPLTQTKAVVGSPLYMCPEQLLGAKDIDSRADLWALGVMLFELLTGRTPFVADSIAELAVAIATTAPPRLRELWPDAPPELDAAIDRCLQKDRARRTPSVAELATDLLPFGPPRARAWVERVTAIAHAAQLPPEPASLLVVPPSPHPGFAGASVAAWASAADAGRRGKALVFGGAAAATAVLLALLAMHPSSRATLALSRGGAPMPAKAAPMAMPSSTPPEPPAEPSPECRALESGCRGRAPLWCEGGRWVAGVVTKGACGAVCTPASTPPRCKDASHVEACSSEGEWVEHAPCAAAQTCKGGACVASPPPSAPECRLVSYFDGDGNQHFRQDCAK